MNAIMKTEHNTTTSLVLRTLKLGKDRMTVKEVAHAANIRESAVEMMLADAVDEKLLRRSRHTDQQIAYTLVAKAEPAGGLQFVPTAKPEAPARPASKPKRTRPDRLPEIDAASIRVTLRPMADARKREPQQTKWGPLFDKLAAITPSGDQYPTVELDKAYGKAIQSAARKYSKDTGVKLKVAIGSKTLIQRVG